MTTVIDPRFLALVVHDLRNPLNVIGLSFRMIEEAAPKDDADLNEDFGILRENLGQIERMLNSLSDYCRQLEAAPGVGPMLFEPARMVSEVVEEQRFRMLPRTGTILLEIGADCPKEVELDPQRARQAMLYALANATSAAGNAPIRVHVSGGPDRWLTAITVQAPAPESVHAMTLQPEHFERLAGTASERQGLELAIVAGICEQLGGLGRLEMEDDRSTTLVLDWPARAPA